MASDTHLDLMRLIEEQPGITQRELAERTGASLGKVNYCLRALADKGWLKAGNFYRSPRKKAYLYKLTPSGIREKVRLTRRFLAIRMREYDELRREIDRLSRELEEAERDATRSVAEWADTASGTD